MASGQREIISPIKLMFKSVNKYVNIKLKDNTILTGLLIACDSNMNMILENAEERSDSDEVLVKYGRVLIRGNNILYIQTPEITLA